MDRLAGQAQHRDVRLIVVGDPGEAVLGDRDLLSRVLLNLVSNAIKFSPPGGTITIDLESGLRAPGGLEGTVVSVAGRGARASRSATARASSSGSRRWRCPAASGRSAPGSDSRSAARSIDLMGGEIWVESEPGRGSTFAFVLPRQRSARSPPRLTV